MKFFIFLLLSFLFLSFSIICIAEEPEQKASANWGQIISKEEAQEYTNDFSKSVDGVTAHLFSSQILLRIMEQKDVVGLRFYHAIVEEKPSLVIFGANEDGNDVHGLCDEKSVRCPPYCGFKGDELQWSQAGQIISIDEAEEFTENFSHNIDGIRAHLFSSDVIYNIIHQENTQGVRFYYADFNQKITLVAVGVNAFGEDMIDGLFADRSWKCPPYCSKANIILMASQNE